MRNGCCNVTLHSHLDGVINLPFATFLEQTNSILRFKLVIIYYEAAKNCHPDHEQGQPGS